MNKQLKTELTQFHSKLDLLFKEGQALFLRHAAHDHAKMIMPELEEVRNRVQAMLSEQPRTLHGE